MVSGLTTEILYHGDCIDVMKTLPSASIDSCVTDPPYGISVHGSDWDSHTHDSIGKHYEYQGHPMPAYEMWCRSWCKEILRILKPGAYMACFTSTIKGHRTVCAIEDVGFQIYNTILWLYANGQGNPSSQIMPAFDPIIIARKPSTIKTLKENVAIYGTGMVNKDEFNRNIIFTHDERCVEQKDGTFTCHVMCPTNLIPTLKHFYVGRPGNTERNEGLAQHNRHPTVKPISLISRLVQLFTPPHGVVIDPFLGSGTTAMAAVGMGRHWIGIERAPEFVAIAQARIGLGVTTTKM